MINTCTLQLDVIERCIELWSNPGETVLTPFMGIGSEVFCAVAAGRKGIGFELKDSYWTQSISNLRRQYDEKMNALMGDVMWPIGTAELIE